MPGRKKIENGRTKWGNNTSSDQKFSFSQGRKGQKVDELDNEQLEKQLASAVRKQNKVNNMINSEQRYGSPSGGVQRNSFIKNTADMGSKYKTVYDNNPPVGQYDVDTGMG